MGWGSTASIKDLATRMALQAFFDKLDQDKAQTWAGLTLTNLTQGSVIFSGSGGLISQDNSNLFWDDTNNRLGIGTPTPTQALDVAGKIAVGSFSSPIDVTATRKYGLELHYSGNDYDVTGIRSRASLITTDTSANATGGRITAANADGINAGTIKGLYVEALGKSVTDPANGNAAIASLIGQEINVEYEAYDTVTAYKGLYLRLVTDTNRTDGYGIHIYNQQKGEANGGPLDAAIYIGTNVTAPLKAYDYGIDMSNCVGHIATAEIRLSNGETISNLVDGVIKLSGGGLWIDGTTGATPTSGAGTRLMWIPAKHAFRVGEVTGIHWDAGNIGDQSAAMGFDAIASGAASVAMGNTTTASGNNSVAMGSTTTASGNNSVAMGGATTASGVDSFAAGVLTTASGIASVAMGDTTLAESYSSIAFGRYNVGGGTASDWVATDPLFEIGMGVSAGARANALTVLKNGNVGIGTATPGETLEVVGNIAVTGIAGDDVYIFNNAGSGIRIRSDSLTTQWWAGDDGPAYFGTVSNDDLHIQTNNNTRITILSGAGSGYVGIGVTDPDAKLEVAGTLHVSGAATFDGTLGAGVATLASGSTIGTLTLADGSITDSGTIIDFGSDALTTTGFVGLGAAASATKNLYIYDFQIGALTDHWQGLDLYIRQAHTWAAGKNVKGLAFEVLVAPTDSQANRRAYGFQGRVGYASAQPMGSIFGGDVLVRPERLAGIGTITNAYGLNSGITFYSTTTGTITNAYGLKSYVETGSNGTITTGYGLHISLIEGASGTFGTGYGIYIAAPSAGIATYYSIYSAGGDSFLTGKMLYGQADGTIGVYSQADGFLDLFADGGVRIGDSSAGAPTNYSKFEPDGTLVFNGAATVFNDLVLPLDSARVPASNAPSWELFVGNLNAFAYQVNDFQEFTAELIHGYKEGSDISFHIHGALNALTAQEEKVRFEIEYSIADANTLTGLGDVFPDGSGSLLTAELVVPIATADLTHIFITVGVDNAGTFGIDATIKGRIRRIAKSAGGNELSGNIFVTQVGVHYEIDTVGSRAITTK